MSNENNLLHVENLNVSFSQGRDTQQVVRGLSFSLRSGESLAIVGESGSGKSVTARSLVGLVGAGSTVTANQLQFQGHDLQEFSENEWRNLRGREVGFVLQDALSSLDPLRVIGREIREALDAHRVGTRAERRQRVLETMRGVAIPEPEVRVKQRSGELSGGLRQRALIASALILDPPLLIADEPTTALDTTIQAQVIELLQESQQRGKSLLLISHDLAVVSKLVDHVLVMRNGEPVEYGDTEQVLFAPQEQYTKSLLSAMPSLKTRGTYLSRRGETQDRSRQVNSRERVSEVDMLTPILRMESITHSFKKPGGGRHVAVRNVSFDVFPGESVGIVGESGSGKTTTARIALGLTDPEEGAVFLNEQQWSGISEAKRRPKRSEFSVVYQDPLGSFDPRWNVEAILLDALPQGTAQPSSAVSQLLDMVGLKNSLMKRHPRQLSGGQRQRVAIARALAVNPRLIVLDEAVSALDTSIQAQILDLFADLKQELGLSYFFISHDIGVISHLCDRVMVMKDGEIVERGTAQNVFGAPNHPYTRELVNSVRLVPQREIPPADVHDPDHESRELSIQERS